MNNRSLPPNNLYDLQITNQLFPSRIIVCVLSFFIFVTCYLLLAPSVNAATLYWQAASGLSNNPNNWSTTDPASCSGGTPSASAPQAADTIIFDADCDGNMAQAAALSVTGVVMQSGYTGTITQGESITVGSGGWDQQGGTFTGNSNGSDYDITINSGGDFSLTGGTFTSTNDTLSTGDNFTINGGTFSANSGTVYLDSSDNSVTFTGSPTFNNLTFPTGCLGPYTYTVASGSTITVSGTLSVGAGCGGTGIYGPGAINLSGDLNIDGSGFCDNSGVNPTVVLTVNGTGSQAITGQTDGDFPCLPGLIINKPSGTLTISNSIEVDGDFTYTSGTVSASSSDILFNGASSASYSISGTITLGTVRFSWNGCATSFTYTIASGTTLTASGDLYGEGGCGVPTVNGPGTLIVQGDINTANNGIEGNIPITLSGSSAQTITHNGGGFPTGTLTVNKTSGTVTLGTSLNLSAAGQDLLLTKGTIDLSTFTLTVNDTITINGGGILRTSSGGDLVVGSGGVNNNGGSINFGTAATCGAADGITITSTSGGSARTWSGNGSYDFYDVAITDMTDQKSAIVAWSSTNNGNNTNVRVLSGCPTPPTSYWKFDEGQGTTAQDETENNWDGTLTNSPTWKTEEQCIRGKCISFDGTDDFVDAGNISSLGGLSAMTVSMWFKLPDLGTNRTLIAKADYQTQDSWAIQTNNSNSDELQMFVFSNVSSDSGDNNIYTTNADLTINKWYHLVVIYDGSQGTNGNRIKFYLNGRQLSTATNGTIPTSLTSASSSAKIGKFGGTLDRYFKGIIDEPKIYNYALTFAQIKTDFNLNSAAVLGANTRNMPSLLSEKLAGYWPMDESSGDSVADQTGNGRTGTATNGPTVGAGKFGNSRVFDGTDDYVNVSYNAGLSTTAQLTISAWIKTTDSDRADILTNFLGASPFQGYGLVINPGFGSCTTAGTVGLWVGDESNGYVCTTATVNDGNWHHIVGTFDGTTGKIYIDGSLSTSAVRTNGIFNDDSGVNLRIGTDAGPATFLAGQIDDVRVYTRTFSASDVSQLYNWAPGPVAYWKMNEKTGTTITDSSGNANTSSAFSGNVAFAQGKYDGGLAFDGTDDVVQVTESSSTDLGITGQSMTVGAWIKTTADTATNQYIVGKNDGSGAYPFVLYLDFNENVCFATYDGSADGNICTNSGNHPAINDGKWHYVTGVRNTVLDKVVVYIDGALAIGGTDNTTGSVANNDDISIGNGATSYTQYDFSGSIDEVKIYNYLRTDAQITEDMNSGHPAPGSPVSSAIGYYRFDDGYGTTAGNSGSCGTTCNGTLTQMSSPATSTSGWNTSGKFGKALNFDGTNDYVDLGSDVSLKTTLDVTVSGWFKLNSDYTSIQAIVSNGEVGGGNCAYHIEFGRTDNKFTWLNNCNSVDATSTKSFADNNWHHFAAVRTGVPGNWTVSLYFDGMLDSTTTGITANPVDPTGNTSIGRTGSFDGQYFNGSLDEIKIFGGALTADQVKLDMNRGASQVMGALSASSNTQPNSASNEYCPPDSSAAVCTKPVGEWKFDEGSGTSANDTSGGGSTGTITGATYVNGKNNKGLNFAGGSDAVTVTNSLSTRTVEFWVNPSTTTENLIDLRTAATAASISVSGGTIAATGFTSPTIYVNGKVSSTLVAGRWQHVTITTGTTITASAIRFGRISSTSLNGKLDQIRIFDYARSQAQVAWDYNKGLPLVWYKMDECQGTTLNDMSGNSSPATITIGGTGGNTAVGTCNTSGAWFDGLIGKRNYSLDFDGTDDYAASSSTIDLSGTGVVTVSIWLKWTSYATDNDLALEFSSDTGAVTTGFYLDPNATGGVFQAFLRGNAGFNGAEFTRPSANEWHNIVVIFDKSQAAAFEITPFVDGKQVSYSKSNSTNSGNPFGNHTLYLMSRGGSTLFGAGQLDDVRIYNYPLTATMIKNIYNEGAARFGPSTGAP